MSKNQLFTRTSIGSMKVKNRMFMCPMGNKTDPDGGVSVRNIDYFVERAKGGFGTIFTGAFFATDKYENFGGGNLLNAFTHVDRLCLLADKLHQYDCKLVVQITAGLGRMSFTDPNRPPYSASECETFYFKGVMCKEYSKEQIKELQAAVAHAASLAKTACADAVELHCYGGYLIDQFQTANWNKRTDEYGGSLENRMRFTLETIAQIREKVGPKFPIIVKYTPTHGIPGYRELDEGLEACKMFEAAGVDAIHVDVGCYEAWYKAISTVYEKEGHQLEVVKAVRDTVSIPVLAQGKLFDPLVAEKVIADGTADMIGLGHQSLADPYWPNKVKAGHFDDIVPCIGCNECMFTSRAGQFRHCAVNPHCYHEMDYPVVPTDSPKKVLVIGGGPGGLEAAITAAQRGHKVTIWEKSDKLGGNMIAAGAPDFKKDVRRYGEYLIRKVHESGVEVCYRKEATVEEVKAAGFDACILAAGSRNFIPPIKGIDGPNVLDVNTAMTAEHLANGKIVIIGAGLVGCEAALQFDQVAESVKVVEIADKILSTVKHNLNNDQSLRQMIADSNVEFICSAKVTEVGDGFVKYEKDGETVEIPADTVIVASGYRANNSMEDELADHFDFFRTVVPTEAPGKIVTTVHAGFHAGRMV